MATRTFSSHPLSSRTLSSHTVSSRALSARIPGMWWLAPLLLALCGVVCAQTLQPVPTFAARVVDLTHTLNPQQQATLEQKLAAFQQRKGSQVVVLIVPTTEPGSHRAVRDARLRSVEAGPWQGERQVGR